MNNQDLFENLSREGIQTTEEQRKNINRRINEVLNYCSWAKADMASPLPSML